MDTTDLLIAIAALVIGGAVGWFAATARAGSERARLGSDRRAAQERAAAAERSAEAADRAWAGRLEDERRVTARRVEEERDDADRRVAEAEHRAEVQLERERTAARERVEELRADSKRLADEFETLSRKALAANTQQFLAQAEERLKRTQVESAAELAKREQAVKQLVEPLTRTLGDVKSEMTEAEKARLAAHTALAEQVRAMQQSSEQLRTETSQLVTALRAPQVRGRWGELQLRRIVEAAGMVEHVDFEEQETVADGTLRPDLVVKLPGRKQIVVDSKVAFSGYLEAMEARDDETRAKRLAAHARHLRRHIDDLGAKDYGHHVEGSPEFTVMFVPAEVFLNAALEQDPTLLEHAFAQDVVIATPSTLVALLRTVGYTWRQEMLAAEAQQVFSVGRELHKRLSVFGGHLSTLAKRLNSTVDAFNKMSSSLDSRVVTQARKFSALQGLEPDLDVPPPLEVLAVPSQKPDLYPAHLDPDEPVKLRNAAAERRAVLDADRDDTLFLIERAAPGDDERPAGRASSAS
ncbi:protein of unknown function DUF195 [Beutenbergia cavernae DSM 12333]|uniref:DNA recombination protein RmuC n=1 Tax=Beutenbergia cavernae (strain ATCC BAA-8 / DSM 12333 / CCUG 43141 / JCM 11478 / NBRC 16432 / NCIMB 13614 / HKI 0122) TaxID=471853 RepID=C5C0V9_BEUC1|nr:DNA recombination protein RmuC [Beutenbergia cavernae]ACQ79363.1 protein of unknown function DUF195 [Beutenbergia cavernae DSM 12333]